MWQNHLWSFIGLQADWRDAAGGVVDGTSDANRPAPNSRGARAAAPAPGGLVE